VEPNPYQPPTESGYQPPTDKSLRKKIDVSVIGLLLGSISLVGSAHIAWTGSFVDSAGEMLAPSGVAGLVLSLIGLAIRPSRLAAVGVAISLPSSLYLAAFWLELISN